jgi:hypothetical protein
MLPTPEQKDIYHTVGLTSGVQDSGEALYFFDPTDTVPKPLDKPLDIQIDPSYLTMSQESEHIAQFVSNMSYDQLTGRDDYDDDDSGYPISELDRFSREFDTREFARTYAVKSWHRVKHQEIDPKYIQPYLGFRPLRIIKKTLEKTTQLAKMKIYYPLRRHIKSRMPHLNVTRINEVVSTDTMFANCRSVYDSFICAQVFFGLTSHMINVYGMKNKSDFPDIYRDFIREQGCPSGLRRDNAMEEKSEDVLRIQRDLFIKDQFTESYHLWQNPVELQAIKYLKDHAHALMDRTGTPDPFWFHAVKYLADIHNICADPSNRYAIPKTVRTGVTQDISAHLQFQFLEKVWYLDHENNFPASNE